MDQLFTPQPLGIDVEHLRGVRGSELVFADSGLTDIAVELMDEASDFNIGDRRPIDRLRAAGIPNLAALQGVWTKAVDRVTRLRHASVLSARDAAHWIVNMTNREPARLLWHIDRLDGISPSSAYCYVAEAQGERSVFTTAREQAQVRLMQRLPDPVDWNMSRGTELEFLARDLLYFTWGGTFKHDKRAFEAISRLSGTRELPWLIGNPDDVLLAQSTDGAARVGCDYKIPRQPLDEDEPVLPDYIVQMLLYAEKGRAVQMPYAAATLCQLYIADDIARMWTELLADDPDQSSVIIGQARQLIQKRSSLVDIQLKPITFDEDYRQFVLGVCQRADAQLQRGELPPWPKRERAQWPESVTATALDLERRLVRGMTLNEAISDEVASIKQDLSDLLGGVDTTKKTAMQQVSIINNKGFNGAAAAEYLRSCGHDTSDLERRGNKALIRALEQLDVDVERFCSPSLSFRLTTAEGGEGRREVERNREYARAIAPQLVARETSPLTFDAVPEALAMDTGLRH